MSQSFFNSQDEQSQKKLSFEYLVAQKISIDYQVKYIKEQQDFIEYKDGYWQYLDREDVKSLIVSALKGQKFSKNTVENIKYFLQMIVPVSQDQLNSDNFLNLENGILCLDTLKLIPHSPGVLSTLRVNYSYDFEHNCPLWLKTISQICEDDIEKIGIIQEYLGYCLTKNTNQHKCLFLFGPSRTGKSIVLETFRMVVGEVNTSSLELHDLSKSSNRMQLRGKLLNSCSEINAKSKLEDGVFKNIVTGEPISVDPKYKDPFYLRPYCKLIFASNVELVILDRSDAIYERFLVLDLKRRFKEHEQDKKLIEKIYQERPGILNWAVIGLKRLRQRGHFHKPHFMQERLRQMKIENSSVLGFAEEKCSFSDKYSTSIKDLYREYKFWCQENNYQPFGKHTFVRHFCEELNVRRFRSNLERMLKGVAVEGVTVLY